MSEGEFLEQLQNKTGCLILLDLNNIFVNAHNRNSSPIDEFNRYPKSGIAYYHLAGHESLDKYKIDTHGEAIHRDVFDFVSTLQLSENSPILIERDHNIPEFSELLDEIRTLETCLKENGNGI